MNDKSPALKHTLTDELSDVLKKVRLLFRCRMKWQAFLIEKNEGRIEQDEPDKENAWRIDNLSDETRLLCELDERINAREDGQLNQLIELFHLSEDDLCVLQICLAISLDPPMANQLSVVQNQSENDALTEYAISRLLGFGRGFRLLSDSPLLAWGLVVKNDMNKGYSLEPQIKAWVLGIKELHRVLRPLVSFVDAKQPLQEWPVESSTLQISELLQNQPAVETLVLVSGLPGSGKKTFAASVCRQLGLPLMLIDAIDLDMEGLQQVYLCAQRQAFLDKCALGWINLRQPLPQTANGSFPLQFVFNQHSTFVHRKDSAVLEIALPPLSAESKKQMWQHYLPTTSTDAEIFYSFFSKQVSLADIVKASNSNCNSLSQLKQHLREQQRRQLKGLAEPLAIPFRREDWVATQTLNDALDDVIYEGKERESLWQSAELSRLFPRGKGLVVLLSGPSGTGKTMAAQIAAAELDRDICRVDLSQVVSKYIGETAENLAKVIHSAESLDVILLFDEADALFSKRTDIKDAHDKYANMDTNYLLQAIENYAGIAFLATNKKANLDTAFIRRLRYVLEFPLPDYAQRQLLWKQLLTSMNGEQEIAHCHRLCDQFAKQIQVTGSQIKFAILSAIFLAKRLQQPLGVEHLLEGIHRELSKDGRSLAEHERSAIIAGIGPLHLSQNKVG